MRGTSDIFILVSVFLFFFNSDLLSDTSFTARVLRSGTDGYDADAALLLPAHSSSSCVWQLWAAGFQEDVEHLVFREFLAKRAAGCNGIGESGIEESQSAYVTEKRCSFTMDADAVYLQ